jgi:hypothetical protein
MTNNNNNNNQVIHCPNCKASITIDELGEHVSSNPDTKKQAVEEQFQLWGGAYDRNYLIQNVVFCPSCGKISHFDDWTSNGSSSSSSNSEEI